MLEVKARWVAMIAGALVAIYVALLITPDNLPDAVLAGFGGPHAGVDRVGGVKLRYRPRNSEETAVELPRVPEQLAAQVVDELVSGGLTMREVGTSDYAAQIVRVLGTDQGYEVDRWTDEADTQHRVGHLVAASREDLEQLVAMAAARGWQVPPGSDIGYELAEYPEPHWRTYELLADPVIDGSMVASAQPATDPNTGMPVVLLYLTDVGRARFCELTRRIAGNKLAIVFGHSVRSAPVINGAICGGRAVIAVGHQGTERDAVALAAVVQQRSLPVGGTVVAVHWQAAADIGLQVWLARLVLGLAAGVVVAAFCAAAIRLARPRWRTPPAPVAGRFPWRRLMVTLLAPVAMYWLPQITLPGLDDIELYHTIANAVPGHWLAHQHMSVVALAVSPVMSAFVCIEVLALAIPRLRWRRHDPRGRRGLGQAAAYLAVGLALLQGYFAAAYIERLAVVVAQPGGQFRIVAALSLAAGTMVLTVIAGLVREHGLGNGYGALVASQSLFVWLGAADGNSVSLLDAFALGLVAVVTACVLRWRIAGGDREPALRVPSSGLAVLSALGGIGMAVTSVASMGLVWALSGVVAWFVELQGHPWVALVSVCASSLVWSWLLARPAVVARVALQAGMDPPARSASGRATLITGAAMLAVVALGVLTQPAASSWLFAGAIPVMIATAVVLDIAADARARRGALAPAWIVHQIQYLGVIERVLGDAAIVHHVHAGNLRTLLAFFGPWAPAIVLVPEAQAAEARALLDAALRPATAEVPVAQVR